MALRVAQARQNSFPAEFLRFAAHIFQHMLRCDTHKINVFYRSLAKRKQSLARI